MKASVWIFSAAMSLSSLALAQTPTESTVVESTDPAKAAEIERRAQQLEHGTAATPMPAEHTRMMKKHSKRHHKSKAKPKTGMKEKAPSEMPAATVEKR